MSETAERSDTDLLETMRLLEQMRVLEQKKGQTQQEVPTATEGAPSPLQALQGFFRGEQHLSETPGTATLEPLAARAASQTAPGRAALSALSGVAGGTGDVLNMPAMVSQLVGGPDFKLPIGSESIANQFGISQQSMSELERALQTVGGFVGPGLFLKTAQGVGILPNVAQKLYKFFSAGPKADIALGTLSVAGSKFGEYITPESPVGPLTGGIAAPLVVVGGVSGVRALRQRLGAASLPEQQTRMTQKATEAFAGPPLQEQLSGGTTTQTAQQGALETFVEAQKQPVYQAQASRQMGEQLLEAQQSRGRMLASNLTQRLRTSDDTAMAALDQSTQRLHAVEARIATERQTSRDAVRQMQEQGFQLGEDRIQEIRAARRTADTNIAALEQQRGQINQQLTETVRQAEVTRTQIQVDARAQTKGARSNLENLEDDLARVTVANEKDMNDYLTFAQKHTESLAPEMAAAQTPEARARVGQTTIRASGEAGQDISARVVTRLRDNAAAKYGILHSNYGIEEEARVLNDIIKKYKPALAGEQPSAAPGELPGVTEQVRQSYAPGRAVRDFEARVNQIAEDIKIAQNLTDAPDLGSVILSLPDMQTFRSRLMDDLRHTPPTSQYYVPLKQLYGEVNEYFWGLGRKYPEAFDALGVVNRWYDTEVHRLMGAAPFAFANITNPLTRERLHTPDEVTRAYFGPGPGVARGTPAQARNEQRFLRYIDDLDSVIATTHLNRDNFYLSPTGYQPTVNAPATLLDAAAARNAKDRLFDAVKVQFYDAATDSAGKYVPAEAAKWLKQEATLIDGNADLKALFQTSRNQANALRDVQAKAQGLLALPEAYVQSMRDALKVTQAEGGEAIFQARLAARQRTSEARLAAEQTQVQVEQRIAQEGETLAQVRQRLADKLRDQRRQEQLARFNREDVTAQTTAQMVQEKLAEEQVRAGIAATRRGERRSLVDERAAQKTRTQQAAEALQRSKETETQILEEYNRIFGNRNAAEHALIEDTFKRTIGTTPEDIVAQIEGMNPSDRNFAYAQWMKKPQMGQPEKEALLQAMWRNHLGSDAVATPAKAAEFIGDRFRQKLLKTYYPDYYDNITTVQHAFEAWEALAKSKPKAFLDQPVRSHVGPAGAGYVLANVMGFGWHTATVIGLTTDVAFQTMTRALHMRKVAGLNQIYLTPQDMAIIANAVRQQRKTPLLANQAALSVLTHAGVIGRETEEAPQQTAQEANK